jgi:ferredoxin
VAPASSMASIVPKHACAGYKFCEACCPAAYRGNAAAAAHKNAMPRMHAGHLECTLLQLLGRPSLLLGGAGAASSIATGAHLEPRQERRAFGEYLQPLSAEYLQPLFARACGAAPMFMRCALCDRSSTLHWQYAACPAAQNSSPERIGRFASAGLATLQLGCLSVCPCRCWGQPGPSGS